MSAINDILAQNKVHVINDVPPSSIEVQDTEQDISFAFPEHYREFLTLGGLNDLRFNNRFLDLTEIKNTTNLLKPLIPFSSNGCGDFFCWDSESSEYSIFLWEHETEETTFESSDFIEFLNKTRY